MALHDRPACELADSVRAGELSAVELLDHYLDRIERLDGPLNSFYFLDPDAARKRAAGIDAAVARGEDPGSWAGVPIGVKELEDVAGWPSEQGCVLFEGRVAEEDSTHFARLRAAGAVAVGKTTSPEFGAVAYTSTRLHGTTRNPYDTERTPGGSSGGSAAAVAAGLVPIATGSDGGGSIRIPAAYTGLFGMKVTFGLIPNGPGVPGISQTAVLGCMARTVRDVARWLDTTVGPDGRDITSLAHPGYSFEERLGRTEVRGLRAAWSPDFGRAIVEPAVREATEAAAMALVDAAGLDLVDVPVEFEDPGRAWLALGAVDAVRELHPHYPDRIADLDPLIAYGLTWGMEKGRLRHVGRALTRRYDLVEKVAELFEQFDVLVTPATASVAFDAEGPMPTHIAGQPLPSPIEAVPFTYPFNLTGSPAASIPVGRDPDGLPVGLQVVCRRHEDVRVMELSRILEEARPWPLLAPGY